MELIGGDLMAYKIAIASSDEIHIDETFGAAKLFHIFEVEDGKFQKVEERIAEIRSEKIKCGALDGCNRDGCNLGAGSGCAGTEENTEKVELIDDCRCVVCKRIGFHIQKQLERKAITAFDVNCTVNQALEKISLYYDKIDKHQSLRGIGG
jgi:hypothetical protein